jgi:hypothetical protein
MPINLRSIQPTAGGDGLVAEAGDDFDNGRPGGGKRLFNGSPNLGRLLHAQTQAAHFFGDAGKAERLKAVQLLRCARQVAIDAVNIFDALGQAAVVIDNSDAVNVKAAGRFQLAQVIRPFVAVAAGLVDNTGKRSFVSCGPTLLLTYPAMRLIAATI